MRPRRTRRTAIDERARKQRVAAETARAIARAIANCAHDYGAAGMDAMCRCCGRIRPRKTK